MNILGIILEKKIYPKGCKAEKKIFYLSMFYLRNYYYISKLQ